MAPSRTFACAAFATLATGALAAGDAPFDPRTAVAPAFDGEPGRAALAHVQRAEHAACARALSPWVAAPTAPAEARLLLGYCELRAGQPAAAAPRLDTIPAALPLLADHARLWSAEAHLALGHADDAIARARAVTAGSTLHAAAQLVEAEALERLARASDAADVYAAYLREHPASWRAGEIRGRLAAALDAAGRAPEAARTWRQVYLESPVSLGARAAPHLDPARPLDVDELTRRATVLFDAMRNKESEAAWLAVLAAPDLTPSLACRARYHVGQSIWKQRDRQRAAPAFEAAVDACAGVDADLFAKSLYQAGRAHGSRAEKDKAAGERALVLYARLVAEAPAHSYADDAALRRADVLDTLGRADEASAQLAAIPDRFPQGDQRGEALFRLAFRAFEQGDAATAQRWLERELKLLPREEGWWEAGRTLYWLARAHDAQGRRDEAAAHLGRAIREYPLSYYALLAFNRLAAAAPEAADRLARTLAGPAAAAPPRTLADRPLFHDEAFRRALALLRLRLGADARRELAAAGLEPPRKGAPLPADRDLGWIASELFEAAGDWAASHAYGRYVDLDYARRWPAGDDAAKWRLSFPRAYAALVEESVAKSGQPAALELAIIREESAFDPALESFANAVGLTQLTAAPAARYAEGLPHDPQALRDPAINVAIGARELGALYKSFDGEAALAIAGYNAGEGAVRRWLRDPDNKDRALDEFVERIPYDETRGYTKRVLGTYFTYAWLDETSASPLDRVPRVRFALPRARSR